MNCKIHLILFLTGTLEVHFSNICVNCYLTVVSPVFLHCFTLTLNYPCSKTAAYSPLLPGLQTSVIILMKEHLQYENPQKNFNR